jgi:hypothetical protein
MICRKKNSMIEAEEITPEVFEPGYVPVGLFAAKEVEKLVPEVGGGRVWIRGSYGLGSVTVGDFLVRFDDGTIDGYCRDAFWDRFEFVSE